MVTDKGRVEIMRRISRMIRVYNPIPSLYNSNNYNSPIKNMIEDIFEKVKKELLQFFSYVIACNDKQY